jgi:hypothetical protein
LSLGGLELDGANQQELLEKLREDHQAETDRRNRIVDKAKAALFIIGVTIPLMISVLTATKTTGFSGAEVVLLGLGVLSLILSAVCATSAVNIRAHHGLHLDDMVRVEGTRIFMHTESSRDLIERLYHCGKLNQKGILTISNLVDAAFVGIRNGLLLLSLAFFIALFRLYVLGGDRAKPAVAVASFADGRAAVAYVEAERNHIERVVIPRGQYVRLYDPQGNAEDSVADAGLVLRFISGRIEVVRQQDAEAILNSGVLARRKIRTTLGP